MAIGVTGSLELTATTPSSAKGGLKFRVNYREDYDIAGNYSILTVTSIDAYVPSGYYYGSTYQLDGILSINGVDVKTFNSYTGGSSVYIGGNNTWYSASNSSVASDKIYHASDGSKTITLAVRERSLGTFAFVGGSYSGWGANGSKSITLTTIPRASTATLNKTSLTADGSSVTITISKAVSTFTSTLTWKYGNKTGTLLNKQTNGSATFTPDPADLYGQGLSGTVYFYLTTYSGNTQIGDQKTYSVSLTIPAVSTIKGTDANIGSVSTLTVSRNTTAYSHSIYYVFGSLNQWLNASGNVSSTEVKHTTTSVPFTIPTTCYAQIPNAKTGTLTVYVKTYYGNSQVGSTQSASFTVTASNSTPTITNVSAIDQNAVTVALTGDSSKQVRYFSNTKFSFTASAKNSASVSTTSIGGVSTGATGSPNRTINGYDGTSISLYVKDSRGYEASGSASPTTVNYIKLTTNHLVYRPQPTDGSAKIVFSGDYFNGSFGAVANAIVLKYRWKEVNGTYSEWVTVTATVSGNKYSATVNLTGFDYQKDYQFNLSIADKLMMFAPEDETTFLRAGQSVFDWGKKDFNINVPLNVNGDITAQNYRGLVNSNYVDRNFVFHSSQQADNPSIGNAWYIKISTAKWNGTTEAIKIRSNGDNAIGETIIHTGSRSSQWWGEQRSYNTTGVFRVKVVITDSCDVYVGISGRCNNAYIYTTFTATVTNVNAFTDGVNVPDGGLFGNELHFNSIYSGGHSSRMGEVLLARSQNPVATANSAWTSLCSLTIPIGTWVIDGGVEFASNANGLREISINIPNYAYYTTENRSGNKAVSGDYTLLNRCRIVEFTEQTVVTLQSWQSSGGGLNVKGSLRAARIA